VQLYCRAAAPAHQNSGAEMKASSSHLILKAFFLFLSAALLLLLGSIVFSLGPKLYYMKSEYVTADVISAVDRFVTEHPRKWPQSWQDIGSEDLSRHTDFRFDLTPDMILRDRQLIYSAIQPKCHQYRTYPHARAQLDGLYEKLSSVPNRQ
jgi:hypothetical protein